MPANENVNNGVADGYGVVKFAKAKTIGNAAIMADTLRDYALAGTGLGMVGNIAITPSVVDEIQNPNPSDDGPPYWLIGIVAVAVGVTGFLFYRFKGRK